MPHPVDETTPKPDGLALPLLLHLTTRAMSDRVTGEMAGRGYGQIRFAHTLLLMHLVAGEGLKQISLANRAGITKQAMGELLHELEQMGIVERRGDPRDRRTKQVWLTERGSSGLQEVSTLIAAMEARLREEVGGEVLESLRHGLLQVLRWLTATDGLRLEDSSVEPVSVDVESSG